MLGTLLERALASVGITKERVERWLGRPCGCTERRDRLDQLDLWARQRLFGTTPVDGTEVEHLLKEGEEDV